MLFVHEIFHNLSIKWNFYPNFALLFTLNLALTVNSQIIPFLKKTYLFFHKK